MIEHFTNNSILDLAIAIPETFSPSEEYVVTLAASAALQLFKDKPEWRDEIGLCVVVTESGTDKAEPAAIHVHKLLNLPSSCRVLDIKHAPDGTTGALNSAANWIRQYPNKKALMIASDITRCQPNSPDKPTRRAGAIALVVGTASIQECLLQLNPASRLTGAKAYNFWQPDYQSVDDYKLSQECYLNNLENSILSAFCRTLSCM